MIRLTRLVTMLAACSLSGFAATSYVIVNNNSQSSNSASAYKLNSSNGTLTFYGNVKTTGQSLGGGQGILAPGQAITSDAHCLFAIDTASNDIAAFASPSYKLVGKFSNSALNFSKFNAGGGIAVSPNGKFLYGAYSGSMNIGAWQVNSNCSLTLIAAYVPSAGSDLFAYLGVSPNGSFLVVSAQNLHAVESFKIGSNGSLTDLGFASFAGLSSCSFEGCFPASLDFTQDSKVVVFGNTSALATVLTANLGSNGALTNPQVWDLPNSQELISSDAVFLNAAAYKGSGFLFVGMVPGVVTADFTENPLSIKTVNSIKIPDYGGGLATIGDVLVLTEAPGDLDTFRVNSDGSLTPLSTVTDTAGDPFWPTIYPDTR